MMMKMTKDFLKDETGATAIEYGLIAAGIAVVLIVTIQLLGNNLTQTFSRVASAVNTTAPAPTTPTTP